jgi:hypothetical protein
MVAQAIWRQFDAILEGAVHALAVEGHHRVRGVAQQHRAAVEVPAIQAQRASMPVGLRSKSCFELGHQRQRVGKSRSKKRTRIAAAAQGGETRLALVGQEQGDGEGLLDVRQRDAHVAAARPDVQRVRFDAEAAIGAGGISSSL